MRSEKRPNNVHLYAPGAYRLSALHCIAGRLRESTDTGLSGEGLEEESEPNKGTGKRTAAGSSPSPLRRRFCQHRLNSFYHLRMNLLPRGDDTKTSAEGAPEAKVERTPTIIHRPLRRGVIQEPGAWYYTTHTPIHTHEMVSRADDTLCTRGARTQSFISTVAVSPGPRNGQTQLK